MCSLLKFHRNHKILLLLLLQRICNPWTENLRKAKRILRNTDTLQPKRWLVNPSLQYTDLPINEEHNDYILANPSTINSDNKNSKSFALNSNWQRGTDNSRDSKVRTFTSIWSEPQNCRCCQQGIKPFSPERWCVC